MSRRRILIVEDDSAIRQGIVDALRFAGIDTLQAGDGAAGLSMALQADCDMVLLDLILPHKDGLQILEEIRTARPALPVIVLTARGDEEDRVKGLRLGADDYVVKPFSVKELLARIEAVLRRSAERPSNVRSLPIPGGVIDLELNEVSFDAFDKVALTEREVELLRYLVSHAGRPISREELLMRVWRIDPRGTAATRTIDMHVASLRSKLHDDPAGPRLIRTIRGKGYLFAGGEESG